MKVLSVVHDEWSAALTDRLAIAGRVHVAAMIDPSAGGRSPRSSSASRLARFTDPGSGAAASPVVGQVLVLGRPSVPPWLSTALRSVPWSLAIGICEDGLVVSDPVHWCIRNGQRRLRLRLLCTDPDLRAGRRVAETRIELSGLDYPAGIEAVADGIAEILSAAIAGVPAGEDAELPDPLPLGRDALRIDWTAPAEVVTRLVRSGAGRTTSAWTYLCGFPVSIERIEAVEPRLCSLPPGTIVREDADGAIIQTGAGTVRVAGVHDMIGRLPDHVLRPGMRFGTDADQELRVLRRRVADLERVIQWMLTERDTDAMPAGGPDR